MRWLWNSLAKPDSNRVELGILPFTMGETAADEVIISASLVEINGKLEIFMQETCLLWAVYFWNTLSRGFPSTYLTEKIPI